MNKKLAQFIDELYQLIAFSCVLLVIFLGMSCTGLLGISDSPDNSKAHPSQRRKVQELPQENSTKQVTAIAAKH